MFIRAEREQEYSVMEIFLNFLIPSNARKILAAEERVASYKQLCSVE